jgi:hypothetical protein
MNKTTTLAVAAIIVAAALVTSSLAATDAFAHKKKRSHDGISSSTEQKCSGICQSNTQIATQNREGTTGGGPQTITQSASNSVNIS